MLPLLLSLFFSPHSSSSPLLILLLVLLLETLSSGSSAPPLLLEDFPVLPVPGDDRGTKDSRGVCYLLLTLSCLASSRWQGSTASEMNDLMTKSFLNYVELKKQAMADLEACNPPAPTPDEEQEEEEEEEENLARFFEEVGAIQQEMELISGLLLELRHLVQETWTTHSCAALRGLRDRMDSDVAAVLRKATIVREKLGALDHRPCTVFREGCPAYRARTAVTNALRAKLREMMSEFQRLREQIEAEHREVLKMRHFNTTGELASEGMMEKLMRSSVVEGGQALEGVVEDRERQRAVGELQRSLTRLHRVFVDMAALVDAQGEQLDDIEGNVARAGVYIGGGTGRMAAAMAMRKEARRNLVCWVGALVLILLLTCVIPIFTGS